MKGQDWVEAIEAICFAAIVIFAFKYCNGFDSVPHMPVECVSSCAPHPMQSFDPSTGKCVCAP